MLSAEAVTHAPIDMGFQLGLETPIGVRAFAGYGWVPSVYKNILISAAAEATGDPTTRTLLESGLESGSVLRVQLGIRPFEKLGLYVDAGYARMKLSGNVSSDELAAVGARTETSYDLDSTLELWEIELGYQLMIADRVVLSAGLGLSRVFDSSTTVTPSQGPIEDPLVLRASGLIDEQLEKYGILPHLTLRLGFDFI